MEELDSLDKELVKKKIAIVVETLEMYLDFYDLEIAEKRLLNSSDKCVKADNFFKELGA